MLSLLYSSIAIGAVASGLLFRGLTRGGTGAEILLVCASSCGVPRSLWLAYLPWSSPPAVTVGLASGCHADHWWRS